jgi:FSR family fosmidomycin resistance protein-like MFS transporter
MLGCLVVRRSSGQPSGLRTFYPILLGISSGHLINDLLQAVVPAVYPILKQTFALSFAQIGLITLTGQVTASLLQPLVGFWADRRPHPYSLTAGMTATLVGVVLLSLAQSFAWLLASVALIGVGSAIFHPESSRIARIAAGARPGLAQSLFQTGGNVGHSLGPLLAAFIVVPFGQGSIAWFAVVAALGVAILWPVGVWAHREQGVRSVDRPSTRHSVLSPARVWWTLVILIALLVSKFVYLASLTSYFTFYLIERFGVSVGQAQIHLFVFLCAIAVGPLVGGPVGDRVGRKAVIWISILGALPLTLLLPFVDLFWTGVLSVCIGVILASAFPAILVFAQELLPGQVGLVSGLFFGLAFGIGGVGAALLGRLADATSITVVYHVCAFLPAFGVLAAALPDVRHPLTR